MSSRKRAGRPPRYETPESLQDAVERYFLHCMGTPVFDADGLPVVTRAGRQKVNGAIPLTISGLSAFLGFRDRHSFSMQAKRGAGFFKVVSIARLRIEAYAEERLYDPNSYNGAAFLLLRAFGWGQAKEMEKSNKKNVAFITKGEQHDE